MDADTELRVPECAPDKEHKCGCVTAWHYSTHSVLYRHACGVHRRYAMKWLTA